MAEKTDATPVLANIDEVFADPADESAQYVASMPPFRDLRRILPAQRMSMQVELAAVASSLPASLLEQEDGDGFDMSELTPEVAEKLATFFQRMQDLVLDNAENRADMENWLLDSPNSTESLQYAFGIFAESLGN